MVSPPRFDHERLDVYQLELKFLTWVTQFLADISGPSLAQTRELREQLDRASLSALLNTAEGNGRRQGRQRAKFFDDARGSAIECAAWPSCAIRERLMRLAMLPTANDEDLGRTQRARRNAEGRSVKEFLTSGERSTICCRLHGGFTTEAQRTRKFSFGGDREYALRRFGYREGFSPCDASLLKQLPRR